MSDIKVPYVLTCRVSGIQKAYTSKDFVNRKIENYGGEEKMVNGYVSRDAKRALKQLDLAKLTVEDVQKVITDMKGTTDAHQVLDLINSGVLFLTKKVAPRAKKIAPEVPEAPVTEDVPVTPEAPVTEDVPVTPEAPVTEDVPTGAAPAAKKSKKSGKVKRSQKPEA